MVNDKVVAIVVTYNRKKLLRQCLNRLLVCGKTANLSIIIIDNNSTDGTKLYIQDILNEKNIYYKNTGKNLGGAGGFNFGIKEAAKLHPKYVWVMDDDCIVQKNTLDRLLKFAKGKNDQFGFLSSKVLWKDHSMSKMNIQRKSMYLLLKKYNKSSRITIGSFVSAFIKLDVIKDIGLPIKDFFIWTDDWEYTRRISRKYPCYFVADSIVIHKSAYNMGPNIVTANSSDDGLFRYKYAYRNEMYLYKREGVVGYMYVYLRNIYNFLFILLFSKNDRIKRVSLIIDATRDGKHFDPKIEYLKRSKKNEI